MTIVNAFLLQNTSSLVVRIIKSDAHAFKILFISKPIPIWIPLSNFEVVSQIYRRRNYFHRSTTLNKPWPPHVGGSAITLTHTTLDRTPLGEWSARRRDLYLTTHNTHKSQTSMPSAGFESAIPASEGPQTHALDQATTGIDHRRNRYNYLRNDFFRVK